MVSLLTSLRISRRLGSSGAVTLRRTIVIALFILSQVLTVLSVLLCSQHDNFVFPSPASSYQLQVPIVMLSHHRHPSNYQTPRRRSDKSILTSLSMSNNDDNMKANPPEVKSNTKRNTDFEYQEMKVILDALEQVGIVSSNRIDRNKANEMNSYIHRVVSDRTSTNMQQQNIPFLLDNTSWTMKYTTMEILPPDTTIQLQFSDTSSTDIATATESAATLKMKYRLIFGSKTLGLNALNVFCDWTPLSTRYDDDDDDDNDDNNNSNTGNYHPMHPIAILALTFDAITMDAFGWDNISLCFLSNLLLARKNRNPPDILIRTVYFDDNIWIEQQEDIMQQKQQSFSASPSSSSDGYNQNVIWNVYRKDTVP